MKKYSSPDIIFESFSLCSSIAASCTRKVDTLSDGECGVVFGNVFVFTGDVGGCAVKVVDGSAMFNGLCYHVPVDFNSLFNS